MLGVGDACKRTLALTGVGSLGRQPCRSCAVPSDEVMGVAQIGPTLNGCRTFSEACEIMWDGRTERRRGGTGLLRLVSTPTSSTCPVLFVHPSPWLVAGSALVVGPALTPPSPSLPPSPSALISPFGLALPNSPAFWRGIEGSTLGTFLRALNSSAVSALPPLPASSPFP